MLTLKSKEEIELIRESALIVSKTLGMLASEVKPGVTTLHLDALAETFIRDHGAIPGFLGMYDFPNTLCMSPNDQVVHGIPNNTPLEEGDIISIDCGAQNEIKRPRGPSNSPRGDPKSMVAENMIWDDFGGATGTPNEAF